jgi:CDP-diglyceride synthetase
VFVTEVERPGEEHSLAGERRRPPTEGHGPEGADTGPQTERVRIVGVEAAVAAGLVAGGDDEDLDIDDDGLDEEFPRLDPAVAERISAPPVPDMQDWTEPATGQVPKVLLEGFDDAYSDPEGVPPVRGPVWREHDSDWDDESDLSDLAEEGETLIPVGSGSIDDEDPYDFDFGPRRSRVAAGEGPPSQETAVVATEELSRMARLGRGGGRHAPPPPEGVVFGPVPPASEEAEGSGGDEISSEQAWENWTGPESGPVPATGAAPAEGSVIVARRTDRRHAARRGRYGAPAPRRSRRTPAATEAPSGGEARAQDNRELGTRIATGLGIAVVAVICFLLGSVATLVLAAVVVTLAAAEAFGALQRAGYRPATLLGLVAVPAAIVSAYLKGPSALLTVTAAFVAATIVWYVAGISRDDPVANVGATITVFTWVGFLSASAGLVLAPATFPHRHGVAIIFGAVLLTVANDVGAFAVGRSLGRHKMAPRVSPGKSWEGFAGGLALTVLLGILVLSRVHPWHMGSAIWLALLVSVLAPLGDLGESQFKRSLGLKDIGTLLPAHGGVLDRIDGMLFVLPAAYLLVRALHLA